MIEDYLRALPNEVVYYFPNAGNAGDSLIALATYQMFHRVGLRYIILHPGNLSSHDLRGKIVLYGGGGNLVSYYTDASDFIGQVHPVAKRLVILPHTVNAHTGLLASLGGNVEIICREQVSFDYVKRTARDARVLLMDDLAFSLDIADAMRLGSQFGYHIALMWTNKHWVRSLSMVALLARWHGMPFRPRRSGRALNSFRLDTEKTNLPIPANNTDVSGILALGVQPERVAAIASYWLLKALCFFDEINTNRLHVCIASIHLNKVVNFYPNNYYKNEAVYRYSIEGRYPNVNWMG